MKTKSFNNRECGSTLAEVIVAVAILAVMGAAIIGSFSYGFFVMSMARENQRATQILLEKTETIRLYSWEQVMDGSVPHSFTNYYDPQSAGASGVAYYGTVQIVDFPFSTSYATNMRQVNITVNWTNAMRGISRTRSISTLTARYGMQNYVF
jgi:hypothetical protein